MENERKRLAASRLRSGTQQTRVQQQKNALPPAIEDPAKHVSFETHGEGNSPITVGIIDPNPLFLEGVASLVNSDAGLSCVGMWTNTTEALRAVGTTQPSVLIVSLSPWQHDDFAVIDALPQVSARTIPLILLDGPCMACPTVEAESGAPRLQRDGVFYGAECPPLNCAETQQRLQGVAVLPKGVSFRELRRRMLSVASADSVEPENPNRVGPSQQHAGLSPREQQVASLVTRGLSNPEIAMDLRLSYSTVKNYVSSILTKLKLAHRTQIALYPLSRKGTDGDG